MEIEQKQFLEKWVPSRVICTTFPINVYSFYQNVDFMKTINVKF